MGARLLDSLVLTVPVVLMYVALFVAIASFGNLGSAVGGVLFGPLLLSVGVGIASLLYL